MYHRVIGTIFDDLLFGTRESDRIVGDTGKDRVYGQQGDDYLSDLSITKPAFYDFYSDQYYGGGGDDIITTFSGNDLLAGGNGDDHFISRSSDSFMVHGGDGFDRLDIWTDRDHEIIYPAGSDDHHGQRTIIQLGDQIIETHGVEKIQFHHFDV